LSVQIHEIAAQFRLDGSVLSAAPTGNGHINDTYAVVCECGRTYILQKINSYVFKNPPAVIENIRRVTEHLRTRIQESGGDPLRETLTLVPTLAGDYSYQDADGETWRVFLPIEGARTYERAENLDQVYQAARAFGKFQGLLSGFPSESLHETIPYFHHTPRRFEAFLSAVRADAHGRAASVRPEIDFILSREAETRVLVDQIESGALPLRVTHNDTKLNNVMIDDRTGAGICVIDLDTVMPGTVLYDFGDMVRSGAALSAEDEPDSTKAGVSLAVFERLAQGYLETARGFLTPAEIEGLAFSARLITLEQAIRFLGDYLNGDVYYKIHRPAQNLDRARVQLRMVQDMEENFEEMRAMVNREK
jgi:Ser/Thr protein kinase RdoA (MazF antagonist)